MLMVVQAGLAALLSRLGAGSDIPIGTPVAGRTDEALERLVGFFVNTLVLRVDTSGNPTFRELVAHVRRQSLDAYAHQDVPFEHLVDELRPSRSLAHHPLFQILLAWQDAPVAPLALPGLRARTEFVHTGTARMDLSVSLTAHHATDRTADGVEGIVEFSTDLFDRGTVRGLVERWERLLRAVVADPGMRIGAVELLGAEERRRLLSGWNDTVREVPEETLPRLFAAQVARTPGATAVVCGEERLTYAELDAAATELALRLRQLGVGGGRGGRSAGWGCWWSVRWSWSLRCWRWSRPAGCTCRWIPASPPRGCG
ncbi:hypothetical protein IHE55_26540 [Streptomyces pactum]|uniref:Condensation domain-containing protein n=2 Tax=Streptomyces pactum TaxID=68249 RepID=A0ABS0NSW4_9ACTN|nr:hypothetical protein [Streptomyces pactum]